MNSLIVDNKKACFEITLFKQSIYVTVSDELSNEILKDCNKNKKKLKLNESSDSFLKEFDFYKHYPYFSDYLSSSYSFQKLESHPYFSDKLKKKIKEEVQEKAREQMLELLNMEIDNPKKSYFVTIDYDPSGDSFEEIRRQVRLNVNTKFKCKDISISLINPQIQFNSIIEDFGDRTITWNFTYVISILNFIGLDETEGALDYLNSISKTKFTNIDDVLHFNFKVIKGPINARLKTLSDHFKEKVQVLTRVEDSHSIEMVILVDCSNQSFTEKQNSNDFVMKTLIEKI